MQRPIGDELSIEVHHEAQPAEDAFVREELDRFNQAAGRFDAIRPLRCFARDSSGELIGAAIGHTWGTSAELGQIWVAEPKRRQGLGSQLLQRFEFEARSRGGVQINLDTFSFHAPEFYRMHGYEVVCHVEGLPDAAVFYILRKALRSR